jgi:hypothetical protein
MANQVLSILESFLADAVLASEIILPIVVKSPQAVAILNVSEQALVAILQAHAAAAAAVVPVVPVVPAVAAVAVAPVVVPLPAIATLLPTS